MRAMWSGSLAFGLVRIPVKMYAATEDRDVKFHQVHVADGGRIKYERRCQTCHEVVGISEIGKGYEDEFGRRIVLSEEELGSLQVPHGRDVEIVEFAPASQIDPINFERAYYLEPAPGANKPYVLLRQTLGQTDRVAVVTVTIRTRSRLAILRVRDDVLVLQTMLWPDEVRAPEFAGISDDDVSVRPQELAMAGSLVESLSTDFDPGAYTDEYREAVLALVNHRLAGEEVPVTSGAVDAGDSGNVVDLMAALQESVRRTQASRAPAAPVAAPDATPPAKARRAPAARATSQASPASEAPEPKRAAAKRSATTPATKRAPARKRAAEPAAEPMRRTGT